MTLKENAEQIVRLSKEVDTLKAKLKSAESSTFLRVYGDYQEEVHIDLDHTQKEGIRSLVILQLQSNLKEKEEELDAYIISKKI